MKDQYSTDAAYWVLYYPPCSSSRRRRYTAGPMTRGTDEPVSGSEAQRWAEFCRLMQSEPARVLVSGWPLGVPKLVQRI